MAPLVLESFELLCTIQRNHSKWGCRVPELGIRRGRGRATRQLPRVPWLEKALTARETADDTAGHSAFHSRFAANRPCSAAAIFFNRGSRSPSLPPPGAAAMGASRSREAASFCSTDDAIPLLESSGPRTPTTTAAGGACSLQVSAFAAASEVGSLSPFFFFFFARGERKRGIFYYFLGGKREGFFCSVLDFGFY